MDLNQAQQLAHQLLQKHGLAGWQFGFDRAKRRFGCCWPKRKLITLSRPLSLLNDAAEVTDTLLHEIAHALSPGGHTRAWKQTCIQIGARPRRCFSSAIALPEIRRRHLYIAACRCPVQHVRKRKPTLVYLCRRCKTKLTWLKQPGG